MLIGPSLKAGDGVLPLFQRLSFALSLLPCFLPYSVLFPSPPTGSFPFSFGADKSGMLSSMSGPMCLERAPQSIKKKKRPYLFPEGRDRMHTHYLTEDKSYGGKQGMLYVASLFKNTESSVLAARG